MYVKEAGSGSEFVIMESPLSGIAWYSVRIAATFVANDGSGEMAEWSKALDWNSSNIRKGVRGFESHSLRQRLHRSPWVLLKTRTDPT